MQNNTYTLAVLGAGNIGSTVIDRLLNLDSALLDIELKKVLVADTEKVRNFDGALATDNFEEILNDDSIQLVIEVLGGLNPGKEYIRSLLENGKS
jgi:homoserine dehydrogenase